MGPEGPQLHRSICVRKSAQILDFKYRRTVSVLPCPGEPEQHYTEAETPVEAFSAFRGGGWPIDFGVARLIPRVFHEKRRDALPWAGLPVQLDLSAANEAVVAPLGR